MKSQLKKVRLQKSGNRSKRLGIKIVCWCVLAGYLLFEIRTYVLYNNNINTLNSDIHIIKTMNSLLFEKKINSRRNLPSLCRMLCLIL